MKRYEVRPLPGYDPVIGRWLWAMQETRRRTLRLVEGMDQDLLDWEGPDGRENTIGTLLYHIAEVEMAWLWWEMKGHPGMPPEIEKDFPFEPVDPETGLLTRVRGIPLVEHVRRLEKGRKVFLEEAMSFSEEYWRTPRLDAEHGAYEATPEWMLFHLIGHEYEHNEQISSLKSRRPPTR